MSISEEDWVRHNVNTEDGKSLIASGERTELFAISGHCFLENTAKYKPEVYVTVASRT